MSQKDFLGRSRKTHGDRYDYSKTRYVGANNYIVVTCKIHGDFSVVASHHYYAGVGCSKCVENMTSHSRADYSKYCPLGSNVYVVRMIGEGEDYCKLGTTKNLHNRFLKLKRESSCSVELLHQEFFTDAGVAWDVEKILHKEFYEYSYTPKIKFGGSTECFDLSIKDEVIKVLQCIS